VCAHARWQERVVVIAVKGKGRLDARAQRRDRLRTCPRVHRRARRGAHARKHDARVPPLLERRATRVDDLHHELGRERRECRASIGDAWVTIGDGVGVIESEARAHVCTSRRYARRVRLASSRLRPLFRHHTDFPLSLSPSLPSYTNIHHKHIRTVRN